MACSTGKSQSLQSDIVQLEAWNPVISKPHLLSVNQQYNNQMCMASIEELIEQYWNEIKRDQDHTKGSPWRLQQ